MIRRHRLVTGLIVVAAVCAGGGYAASAELGTGTPTKLGYLQQNPTTTTGTTQAITGPPPTVADPWLAYRSDVNPGPAIQFVSAKVGWRLNEPATSPGIDENLSSGPNGSTMASPGNSIALSQDGGSTWSTILREPTGIWGFDVLSPTMGWAVGVTSLEETTDGGATWQQLAEPTGSHLVSVDFVSPTDGFGLTTVGKLVKTIDGGHLWTPSGLSTTGSSQCFVSAQVGYVADASGNVYSTNDGGATWSEARAPTGIVPTSEWPSLSCSGTVGWLSLAEVVPGRTGEYLVEETSDSGSTWALVASNDQSVPALATLPTPVDKLGAATIASTGTGYLVGYPTTGWALSAASAGSSSPRSFHAHSLPTPASSAQSPPTAAGYIHVLGLSFFGTTGWLYFDDTALGTSTSAATERWEWGILKSSDGGNGWTLLATSGPEPVSS